MASRRGTDERIERVSGAGTYMPAYLREQDHVVEPPVAPVVPVARRASSVPRAPRAVHRGAVRPARRTESGELHPRSPDSPSYQPYWVATGCVNAYTESQMDLTAVDRFLDGKRVDRVRLFDDLRKQGYPQIIDFIESSMDAVDCA